MTPFLRILAALIPLPLALLGALAWTGFALGEGSHGVPALLFSVLLLGLPVVGLSALAGRRPGGILLAGLIWPVIALGVSPLFFPGDRAPAIRRGAGWLGSLWAPLAPLSETVGALGQALSPLLGEDPTPPPAAAPRVTPTPKAPRGPVSADSEVAAALAPTLDAVPGEVRIPVNDFSRSLALPVTLYGPDGGTVVDMIFDTGASMTTVEPGVLRSIGAAVNPANPKVTLTTAGGQRSVKVAYLDRVTLGMPGGAQVSVPGVSVAACKACSSEGTAGLLGLNVTSLFQVTMDYEGGAILLKARGEGLDRLTDVRHWLTVESTATQAAFGPVEIAVRVKNGSLRPVHQVDVEVRCNAQSFSIQIDGIPPGETGRTEVRVPRDSECARYHLDLLGARW